MNRRTKKILTLIMPAFLLVAPFVVFGGVGEGNSVIPNPLGNTGSFPQLIAKLLDNIVIPIGGALVTFFIIFSGFLFVTAQGNEEKLKTAKTSITWTFIGAAVLLGAKAIATLIEGTIKQL